MVCIQKARGSSPLSSTSFSNTCPPRTAAAYSNGLLVGIIGQRSVGRPQSVAELLERSERVLFGHHGVDLHRERGCESEGLIDRIQGRAAFVRRYAPLLRQSALHYRSNPGAPRVHPGVSPGRGGSFRRVLRTQALRRCGCRARHPPVTGPPAVPAVSCCRARQHHGQAVTLAPGALVAGRWHSHRAGTPRVIRVGPLQRQGHPKTVSKPASQKRSLGPTLERRRPLPTQRA
jgi:hypothetical protein